MGKLSILNVATIKLRKPKKACHLGEQTFFMAPRRYRSRMVSGLSFFSLF